MVFLLPAEHHADFVRPRHDLDRLPGIQAGGDAIHVGHEGIAITPADVGQEAEQMMRPKTDRQSGR